MQVTQQIRRHAPFRSLNVSVLYVTGKRSTPPARAVARLLTSALLRIEVVEFEDLGHMGPVTHPEVVNAAIKQLFESSDIWTTPTTPRSP